MTSGSPAADHSPWLPTDELTVLRYRTEKPSKSPPPPPPRRSFPSTHGLTTTRTGEVVVTSKKDSAFIKVPLPPGEAESGGSQVGGGPSLRVLAGDPRSGHLP